MSKLRWKCGSDIHCWIFHWMSGRGAHTKNIPSHPIVVYHPYTWEHYSHYNNNLLSNFCYSLQKYIFFLSMLSLITNFLINVPELLLSILPGILRDKAMDDNWCTLYYTTNDDKKDYPISKSILLIFSIINYPQFLSKQLRERVFKNFGYQHNLHYKMPP